MSTTAVPDRFTTLPDEDALQAMNNVRFTRRLHGRAAPVSELWVVRRSKNAFAEDPEMTI